MERLASCCRLLDDEPLPDFASARARRLLPEVEILITSWGCPVIDAAVLDQAPGLRAVVHAAGTVKSIFADAVWKRGLQVSSAAGANAVPVAEYTLAVMLLVNKGVFELQHRYERLREAFSWPDDVGRLGNYRKLVGIVGASEVGRRVLELLAPFDLRAVVHDPTLDDEQVRALGGEPAELDDLLSAADVVSLHAPLLPSTRHMIDRRRLKLMREGATLINTARGALVDHAALTQELVSGRLRAVIDTSEPEPLPGDSPLWDLPNVVLTPHVAGSQGNELARVGAFAVAEVERYLRGEPLHGQVSWRDLGALA
jgi:phosphoglycerate dehydrogenase-like enzyme